MNSINTNPATRTLGAMRAVSLVGIGLYAITLAAQLVRGSSRAG